MRIIWPRTTLERDTLETEDGKKKGERKMAIENESPKIALVNVQLRLRAARGGGRQRRDDDDDATRGCQIEWNANFTLSLPFSLSLMIIRNKLFILTLVSFQEHH